MSFIDQLVLWLHIVFVIFAIGPLTIAIMSTPRYIRSRNVVVLRYLHRITFVYSVVSLGVLIFGLILAQLLHDIAKPWVSVSMTLFVVALVLLALVMRDQRRVATALEDARDDATVAEAAADEGGEEAPHGGATAASLPGGATQVPLGQVERGRIASLGGVVTLIWLVILVLMVWK
jgi:hypothetical protein